MAFLHTRSRLAAGAGVLLLAGTALACWRFAFADPTAEKTEDAYVAADYTLVAPRVSGLVDKVLVEDNQAVQAGQALIRLDDRDFRTTLRSAEADVSAAKAEVASLDAAIRKQPAEVAEAAASFRADQAAAEFARSNAARYRNLSTDGAGTQQESQQASTRLTQSLAGSERDAAALSAARLQLDVLQASRTKALAALGHAAAVRDQARLNLSYTVLTAPMAGFVGRRSVRPGSYVTVGSALLAVVPSAQAYVVANFQESQVRRMRLRQPTLLTIDSFPGVKLRGHVDSLAPATDVAFAPIQPDNATGNFTKIVQRVPVKIVIEPGQPVAKLIRVGMSVVPTVDTTAPGDAPLGVARSR